MICFPHGGGGPNAYRSWPSQLPGWLEVWGSNPPGRGVRHREPSIDDMAVLVDTIVGDLRDLVDLPVVLFGHSVGALVAFEVARRLEREGLARPLHVFVSGHAEPNAARGGPDMSAWSDDALIGEIGALGLLPTEALAQAGLADIVLPPLRADFRLAERYQPDASARIDAPLTAMGGADDPIVDADRLDQWRVRTTADFDSVVLPGGHCYTEQSKKDLLDQISVRAERALAALPPSIVIGAIENYPLDTCLHEHFRRQARSTPDATALVGVGGALTFAALDSASDALAQRLVARGCGVDRMVAIVLETSVEFVVAYLAILKAGGAYLPIPLVTPDAAIADILETVRPVSVVTRRSLEMRLPAGWRTDKTGIAIDVDSDSNTATCGYTDSASGTTEHLPPLDDPERPLPGPDSLAYCVMTSGTTGRPKGIVCPHKGAVNSYWWRIKHLPYGGDEREACNVFFVWEVLRPLLQGRPAYVIPDDVIFDPRRLIDYLEQNRITRVLFTPSLFEQVLNAAGPDIGRRLSALRMVILNGEVVSLALSDRAAKVLPRVALVNDYSISECHDVTTSRLGDPARVPGCRTLPAGSVMANVRVYILGDDLSPMPWGVPGEVYVAGPTLARGYLDLPEETALRFVPDPFQGDGGSERMFRTGDIGRLLPDGRLELRGRAKFMVKLRGYSVVPSAIEAVITAHPAIGAATVVTVDDRATGQPVALAAYVVGRQGLPRSDELDNLGRHLKERLPAYAIPAHIVPLAALPIQASTGKVDRRALPAVGTGVCTTLALGSTPPVGSPSYAEVQGSYPAMAGVWATVLGRPVSGQDNFFDLGGHSLKAIDLAMAIEKRFGVRIDVVDVFNHPTLAAMGRHVRRRSTAAPVSPVRPSTSAEFGVGDVAVIAMACRFPGADSPEQLWDLLTSGAESVRSLGEADLRAAGVPAALLSDNAYSRRAALVDGVDLFDPGYFGLSDREAVTMDPQHRLFLECCTEVLARAGRGADDRDIGVWAGCYLPTYLVHHLGAARHLDPADPTAFHLAEIGNDKDYLASRVAYLLGLEGPALAVQTSCSTGLVAIAEAAAALRAGRCRAALAGASSLTFPRGGYRFVDGHIGSRSGHCRTFDSGADGTILGDGVGVVMLKRIEDALSDGNPVLAVMKGFAVNNDGNAKAGYSAPSGRGQAAVIRAARDMAGRDAPVAYVEAHGTATVVGDPIEVRALAEAYADLPRGSCLLGSIKANIGHSNIAAGVAGFVKAVQVLSHRHVPPQINYASPNPEMRLSETPFVISTTGVALSGNATVPHRAAVSSFGIGGTNCHVILEKARPHAIRSITWAPPRFERRRIWPTDDPSLPGPRPAVQDQPSKLPYKLPPSRQFYVPSEIRLSANDGMEPAISIPTGAAVGETMRPPQRWLVLTGSLGQSQATGKAIADQITASGHEVTVSTSLDPAELSAAISALSANSEPARIVTTWHLGGGSRSASHLAAAVGVDSELAPVMLLCRLLHERPTRSDVAVFLLACGPPAAVIPGILATLQQEQPTVEARLLALPAAEQYSQTILTTIVNELTAELPRLQRVVLVDGRGVRTAERFDPLTLGDASRRAGRERLARGPHIVIGGSGRIGQVLAAHLSELGADVVSVSRQLQASPTISKRCQHVAADVTDPTAMAQLLARVAGRHGRLGGIFHAAGLAKLQDLADATPSSVAAELAPKVQGTRALLEAVNQSGHDPDFVMLFSSLAAVLGGLGLGVYAAANRYLDAVAQELAETSPFQVVSVAWDDWDFDYGSAQQAAYAHTRSGLAIEPADGLAAIAAVLGEPGLSRVLVSATPLEPRLEQWVERPRVRRVPVLADASEDGGDASARELAAVRAAYVAILGRSDAGLDDDFFALGGDSLFATEIVAHIAHVIPTQSLRVADVLDHPTIRKLAVCLAAHRAACQSRSTDSPPNGTGAPLRS
jgi:amino acid adenylation domain-containing protein